MIIRGVVVTAFKCRWNIITIYSAENQYSILVADHNQLWIVTQYSGFMVDRAMSTQIVHRNDAI